MPRVLSDADVAGFRTRLCAAAEQLFAEQGIEAVTMRQLAVALGVSPMTPYRYFRDKDEIIDAVRTNAYNRFADALEAAFDSRSDPVERSIAVGEAYLDFAVNHSRAYALMFDVIDLKSPPSDGLAAAGERAKTCQFRHVQGLIDAGVIVGEVSDYGNIFWAIVYGFAGLLLLGQMTPDEARRLHRLACLGTIAAAGP
ncbi:MAG: TetR/AcrR family transcriptional regulator [Phenylobacterium sp.]|nr:TetR/AcrR family transcriptional regulator [Phenylobacterium sp.]